MMENKSENKPKKKRVSILCEGKIERNYFSSYKKEISYENINIEVELLDCGNYRRVRDILKKSPYLGIPFVVLDLDRAMDSNELGALNDLITIVREKKGVLFLTYKNFEDWISAHFDNKKRLEEIFRVRSQSDLKDLFAKKHDLYQCIQKCGGKIENAINHFSKKPLYLNLDFQIEKQYLHTEQSGLHLLDDAFKKIN